MAEVKMYVTTYCGYCHAAKALLNRKGVTFQEIDCTNDAAVRRMLIEKTGRRTVPQIFIDGVPVGGYDDINALDRRGELDKILAGQQPPQAVV